MRGNEKEEESQKEAEMRNYINDEEDLEKKEIMQIIRRMKKAAGVDKIPKEV